MTRKLLLSVIVVLVFSFGFSQTKEELQAQKAEKQAEVDKYQAEVDAIQAQIDALPGWRIGAFGTIGGSLSQFNNWYAQGSPNNEAGSIGFTVNGFTDIESVNPGLFRPLENTALHLSIISMTQVTLILV